MDEEESNLDSYWINWRSTSSLWTTR